MRNLILLSLIMLFAASCQQPVEQTPAQELMAVINRVVEQNQIMYGHQDDRAYGHTWKYEDGRSDVLETAGDYPAVMGWDIARIELEDSINIDGVPFEHMRKEIVEQHKRGGINTISWHAYTPDGKDSWVGDMGVVTNILPNGKDYDKFQSYLEKAAQFLLSLKDEEGKLIPVIFRPWHEHEGNWFWWGEKRCTHQEYRELWNMTYDYMAAAGLNSLVWAYMPFENQEDKIPAADRFDMLGIDSYQQGPDSAAYLKSLKEKVAGLVAFGEKYQKPVAITEIGYEGIHSDVWWTEVLYEAMKGQPLAYVLTWRNAWDRPEHFYSAYPGHSSEANFKEFMSKPEMLLVNEL